MARLTRLVAAAQKRRRKGDERLEDEGFTLIELLVVLLIIGILLAIAIPTFLSVTKTAGNTAAQSNLQTALTASKGYYVQNGGSYATLAANWATLDSGLTSEPASTVAANSQEVSINADTSGEAVALVTYSQQNGDCWAILDDTETGGTPLGAGAGPATVYAFWPSATGTPCEASQVISSAGAIATAVPTGGTALETGFPTS